MYSLRSKAVSNENEAFNLQMCALLNSHHLSCHFKRVTLGRLVSGHGKKGQVRHSGYKTCKVNPCGKASALTFWCCLCIIFTALQADRRTAARPVR